MSNRQPDSYDFRDIQEVLQQFLSTNPEFKDVNWKGSVASRLVDLHAYNTSINASSVGFAFNESSLHSATIRSNAAAKASGILNYLPASKRCSELRVRLEVIPNSNPDDDIAFDREVRFVGVSNQVTLNFVPDGTYRAKLIDGSYTFDNVRLLQGERITNKFVVKTSESIETYVIPNQRIDINTLSVMVKEGNELKPYTQYTHPNQLGKDNRLFYIRINPEGKYVIEFGDDVFSRRVQYSEVIVIDYIATYGAEGNGASKVAPSGLIGGSSNITVTNLSEYSAGGSDEESIESIKRLAPLGFGSTGVCVTPSDFISATKRIMGESVSVNAWGGEENSPPKYGYSYVSVRYQNGGDLDQNTKEYLQDQIKPLCVGQITPIIIDAQVVRLSTEVTFEFNSKRTVLSQSQIERKVADALIQYSKNNLERFSIDFDHSKLNSMIKTIDNSIISGEAIVKMYKTVVEAESGFYYSGSINFGVKIIPSSVIVQGFKPLENNSDLNDYYLVAQDNNLVMKRKNKATGAESTYPGSYGSVDYDQGVVNIRNLYIDQLDSLQVWTEKSSIDKSLKSIKDVIFQVVVSDINGVAI